MQQHLVKGKNNKHFEVS